VADPARPASGGLKNKAVESRASASPKTKLSQIEEGELKRCGRSLRNAESPEEEQLDPQHADARSGTSLDTASHDLLSPGGESRDRDGCDGRDGRERSSDEHVADPQGSANGAGGVPTGAGAADHETAANPAAGERPAATSAASTGTTESASPADPPRDYPRPAALNEAEEFKWDEATLPVLKTRILRPLRAR
jgi:hypothetical protein